MKHTRTLSGREKLKQLFANRSAPQEMLKKVFHVEEK
jgi:hypothetical protein